MSTCTYCGADATTKDHVIPIAYIRNGRPHSARSVGTTVDCCRECNNLLGAKALFTIQERAEEINLCLGIRYRKELNAPVWTEDELNELGPSLQKQTRARQFLRDEVLERIRNASAVAKGYLEAAIPLYDIPSRSKASCQIPA